jgi:hypothetical protein
VLVLYAGDSNAAKQRFAILAPEFKNLPAALHWLQRLIKKKIFIVCQQTLLETLL